jgi:phosphatidylethanolamine/phosphatidyl-N-methylethanolamine N-methyltransferase
MIGFLGQAVKHYRTTGAIAPSSAALARVMTESLRRHQGPKRVLEVGPGTGAFTKRILHALKPGDAFDIVEINPAFSTRLRRELLEEFIAAHPQISVNLHNHAIQTAPVTGEYDYVVCGLPFNNFPLSEVSRIFRRMMSLLREGGELMYFEYLGMKAVKMMWFRGRKRGRVRRRIALAKAMDRRYNGSRRVVLRNFPPASAFRLRA